MLPAALLNYRVHGEQLVPAYLGELDYPWIRALIDERERFVGRPCHELAERWKQPLSIAAPPRKRNLAAHVLDTLARPHDRPPLAARQVRAALFTAAASSAEPRSAIVDGVARSLGTTSAAIESSIFADLPRLRPVAALAAPIAPIEVAARCNLLLVQGLLARAQRVRITLLGNALPVIRRAKLYGLIVNVIREPNGTSLLLSGPLALFRHTRLYGRALGSVVPLLAWCSHFKLEAHCHVEDRRHVLHVATGDPIFPSGEPRPFDSALEARFARDMRRAARAWNVIRDPEPLETSTGLAFPDFVLVHRDDPTRRWLVEIVGFWTEDYLRRKLEAYASADADRIVLCVDEKHRCNMGELPIHASIVWFRRRIDPQLVLAAIGEEHCRSDG